VTHKPSREDLNSESVYNPNIKEYTKKQSGKRTNPKDASENSFVNQDRLSSHETQELNHSDLMPENAY